MPNDLVIVYEPEEKTRYDGAIDPAQAMVLDAALKFPRDLVGQFRIFFYMMQGSLWDQEFRRTGVLYTRGEEDNPLTIVDGSALVASLENFTLSHNFRVRADHHFGELELDNPKDGDYIAALEISLSQTFEQIGLRSPAEIRRFLIAQDTQNLERIIKPYLQEGGYQRIETKKF